MPWRVTRSEFAHRANICTVYRSFIANGIRDTIIQKAAFQGGERVSARVSRGQRRDAGGGGEGEIYAKFGRTTNIAMRKGPSIARMLAQERFSAAAARAKRLPQPGTRCARSSIGEEYRLFVDGCSLTSHRLARDVGGGGGPEMVFRARLSRYAPSSGSQVGKYMRADEPGLVRVSVRPPARGRERARSAFAYVCVDVHTRACARVCARAFVNPAGDVHRFGGGSAPALGVKGR